jgi:hypothetical protein
LQVWTTGTVARGLGADKTLGAALSAVHYCQDGSDVFLP